MQSLLPCDIRYNIWEECNTHTLLRQFPGCCVVSVYKCKASEWFQEAAVLDQCGSDWLALRNGWITGACLWAKHMLGETHTHMHTGCLCLLFLVQFFHLWWSSPWNSSLWLMICFVAQVKLQSEAAGPGSPHHEAGRLLTSLMDTTCLTQLWIFIFTLQKGVVSRLWLYTAALQVKGVGEGGISYADLVREQKIYVHLRSPPGFPIPKWFFNFRRSVLPG